MTKTIGLHYALLLDSGNTRLKTAVFDMQNNCFVGNTFAIEHKQINKQNISLFFSDLINNLHPSHKNDIQITKVLGVNVAGFNKQQHIDNIFFTLFNIKPYWITVQRTQSGVLNHYKNIKKLGVDRWVSMVGLSKITPSGDRPCILASFGTATTIDTLVPNHVFNEINNSQAPSITDAHDAGHENIDFSSIVWHFIGGTILPGPTLMATSLETNTANLPNATGATSDFPLETFQAISSGIVGAQAGAVLRQWQAAYDQYKTPPNLYISGGGVDIVEQELNTVIKKAQTLNNIKACAITKIQAPIMYGLATFID